METIKPQELRIGNLVNWKSEQVRIEWIRPDDVGLTDFQGALFHQKIRRLSGINLTPDWLKRFHWNGYQYLYINSYFSLDEDCHLYYHGDYTGINVYHVHSLQNLYFALTGQELTPNIA